MVCVILRKIYPMVCVILRKIYPMVCVILRKIYPGDPGGSGKKPEKYPTYADLPINTTFKKIGTGI